MSKVRTTITVTFEGEFPADFTPELQIAAEKFLCNDIIDTVSNRIWTHDNIRVSIDSVVDGDNVRHNEYHTGG